MRLDDRTLRLIAVGASIAANCQPCLQTNMAEALKCGADEQEIAAAIQVGRMVRKGAASKMDAFADGLKQAVPQASVSDGACGCGS